VPAVAADAKRLIETAHRLPMPTVIDCRKRIMVPFAPSQSTLIVRVEPPAELSANTSRSSQLTTDNTGLWI
jgi:hypothetical protein